MKRNSIRWRLPASYGIIALLTALSLGSLMLLSLRSYYSDQEHKYLLGNAIALQPILEQVMQAELPVGSLQDQISGLAFLSQVQIRLLDADGHTIADSGVPNHKQVVAVAGRAKWTIPSFSSGPAEPPEGGMRTAIYINNDESAPRMIPFEGEIPYSGPASKADIVLSVNASPYGYGFVSQADFDPRRRSSQIVSVPLTAFDGKPLGVLEFSNGPSYGADIIDSVTGAWLLASIFAIVIAALAGWFVSKQVTHPVLALQSATRQMEQGDLSVRVDLQNEKQQEFLSLADSFNGMAAQVEKTISTLREFAADAAHELHTPLTALLANLELAHDEKSASARTRYLVRAQEQGQRLEALVESLLDLSRIEAARSRSGIEPVNFTQILREVGEQFASRAEQMGREFEMNLAEEDVTILGNQDQLRQVLMNLLENALKFTPRKGSIAVILERAEKEARLTVIDTGIGIPPEDLPHLFERFHRGRNAAEYAGNGLGLAIVKAIVLEHRGAVSVRSQPGHGTEVNVAFPLASMHRLPEDAV